MTQKLLVRDWLKIIRRKNGLSTSKLCSRSVPGLHQLNAIVLLFVGAGGLLWSRRVRRPLEERKKGKFDVKWSNNEHQKVGRNLYQRLHHNSNAKCVWKSTQEQSRCRSGKSGLKQHVCVKSLFLYWAFTKFVISDCGPCWVSEILEIGDILNATRTQRLKVGETTAKQKRQIINCDGSDLMSFIGNLEFGTEIWV